MSLICCGCAKKDNQQEIASELENLTEVSEVGELSQGNTNDEYESGEDKTFDFTLESDFGGSIIVKHLSMVRDEACDGAFYEVNCQAMTDEMVYAFAEKLFDDGIFTDLTPDLAENEAETLNEADGARVRTLSGTVNGETWMLEVAVTRNERELTNEIFAYCLSGRHEVEKVGMGAETIFGENCSNEVLCRKQAVEFYEKLGFSCIEPTYVRQNLIAQTSEDGLSSSQVLDGYEYDFALYDMGSPCFATRSDYSVPRMADSEETAYATQPVLAIGVEQGRVQTVYISNFLPECTLVHSQTEFVQEEKILEKAKDIMAKKYGMDGHVVTMVNCTLKLQYVLCAVRDEKQALHYDIIPCWLFYEEPENFYGAEIFGTYHSFGINALDGSEISFYDSHSIILDSELDAFEE